MNNLEKLARMFGDRDNPPNINITIGRVISISPLRIGYGESVILESRHLHVASALIDGYTGNYEDSGVQRTLTVKVELKKGDKVMLIPDNTMKKWFVIDKVVEL